MQRILHFKLKLLAKLILRRHRPVVVAITGSVGKTSAKEAIYTVVTSKFRARTGRGNYNNELGVPLTIIGAESGGKNLLKWAGVFAKAIGAWFDSKYPEVLVLEFGADKKGDIAYLMRMTKPRIGVLTAISKVHLETFKTLENIIKEKTSIISLLPEHGWAIINADDPVVAEQSGQTKASVLSCGTGEDVDIRAEGIQIVEREGTLGLGMKIMYKGNSVPMFLPGVTARHQVHALLSACGVGVALGMNLVEVGQALNNYEPPKGRTSSITGLHRSLIIDDTYNASPIAVKAALKTLQEVQAAKRGRMLAVLGGMLELGEYEDQGHREVGFAVAESGIDFLITVGELAKKIAEGAREAGMPHDIVRSFDAHADAIGYLKGIVQPQDIILVKGSQGARMEKVVKGIMAHPEDAERLLVRQSKQWLKR